MAGGTQTEGTVDDRGESAIVTLTARDLFGNSAGGESTPGGTAAIAIECHVIEWLNGRPTPTAGIPTSGDWTGTVTITTTVDYHKTDQGQGDDPNSTYYETWTTDNSLRVDARDTFHVSASDPADLTYGIHKVDLDGSAGNAGSMDLSWLRSAEKRNSGCTWHQDNGTEQHGSWTASGRAKGYVQFGEDGTYSIDIRADTAGPGGVLPPNPKLPERRYEAVSNLSANCEGEGYDTTTDEDPVLVWATRYLGERTIDGLDADIQGRLDPTNPGSVVAGTLTWTLPDWDNGVTVTAEWRLEHDGRSPFPTVDGARVTYDAPPGACLSWPGRPPASGRDGYLFGSDRSWKQSRCLIGQVIAQRVGVWRAVP